MRSSRPREGISGFDGLRAIAALTVLSYHVALANGLTRAGWLAPAWSELKGGVAIFFVISGALLYLPYARAVRDRTGLPDWRGYARRRAVRILPAYWVALTVVAVGPFHARVLGADAGSYYGLSQIYLPRTLFGGIGVAWSLCVEMTFYALLPLFAALAARLATGRGGPTAARTQIALIAAAGLGSLALRYVIAGSVRAPTGGATLMVSLPGLMDWFAVGMSLAVLRAGLEARDSRSAWTHAVGRRPGWCALLALGAFAAGLPWQHGDTFLPWYGVATHIALGVGSGLLVLSVIVPRPDAARSRRRVLSHPLLTWVGTISYSIYLWHLSVLQLIAPHLAHSGSLAAAALTWLAVVGGAVACGAASWYFVERPLQRLFAARRRDQTGGGTPGHMTESHVAVQSTVDPLNSSRVAVDHLA
ncbi:MAG: acyltransferase [Solirubrobacterales bacterium]|nr:acyltransferase [Solirubrobacterales bacterium]